MRMINKTIASKNAIREKYLLVISYVIAINVNQMIWYRNIP